MKSAARIWTELLVRLICELHNETPSHFRLSFLRKDGVNSRDLKVDIPVMLKCCSVLQQDAMTQPKISFMRIRTNIWQH